MMTKMWCKLESANPLSGRENPLDDSRLTPLGVKNPLVSVIVTNFNYERYILSCLKSVSRQTYSPFECIVVDDCSSDNSVKIIRDFIDSEESGGRFSLVCREINGGQLSAFRTGLKQARGVFVLFLDADDLLLEDFLNFHVRAHMGDYSVAFTSSDQYQINADGDLVSGTDISLQARGECRVAKPVPLYETYWIWSTSSSIVFRKAILDLIMPDDCSDFRICADHYVCHFAHLIGGSMLLPIVMGCYRRHGLNNYNFNTIIGRQVPAAIMEKQPRHEVVRSSILRHMLDNYSKFSSFLTEEQISSIVLKIVKPFEVFKIKKKFPKCFPGRSFIFILKLFAISFIISTRFNLNKSDRNKRRLKDLFEVFS